MNVYCSPITHHTIYPSQSNEIPRGTCHVCGFCCSGDHRAGDGANRWRRIFRIKSQGGPAGLGSTVIKCSNITLVHVHTRFRDGDSVAKYLVSLWLSNCRCNLVICFLENNEKLRKYFPSKQNSPKIFSISKKCF